MTYVTFSNKNALPFIEQNEIMAFADFVSLIHNKLHNSFDLKQRYLGWLGVNYETEEFQRIKYVAKEISEKADVLIVIGVGGSYLGAHAAIRMLKHSFNDLLEKDKRLAPLVIFAGHNLSSTYMYELMEYVEDKDICINVISKSGTTAEPAIAFRVFRGYLEKRYGKEKARERIYVTTDRKKGKLKSLAETKGYETFEIPSNIGGRNSVLTPAGLLPIAVSGIDIDEIIMGAQRAMEELNTSTLKENPAYQYAVCRNILYNKGFTTEILANYEPALEQIAEWWKQLFGESEGKEGKGIFPAAANFTTDLHAFGQYIQDGRQQLFETVLQVRNVKRQLVLDFDSENLDELNYLSGKSIQEINNCAFEGAMAAHTDGGVPNLVIELPFIDPYTFGYMVYFFQKACAMSGYLLGVNPFDQPGVEAYKRNMHDLLRGTGSKHYKA